MPCSASQSNTPVNISPPKIGANQSFSATSVTPPIMVFFVLIIAIKIVMPRRIYKNARLTIKEGKFVLTVM